MTGLWIGITLLTILALAFVFLPYVKAHRLHREAATDSRQSQNIEIFRDRLSELERELAHGSLDQATFAQLKLELEKNLLIDVEDSEEQLPPKPTGKQLTAVALLALITVSAALGIYARYGSAPELELALNQPKDPFNGRTPTLEEAVAQLELELKSRPENAEGWYMLASSYMNMGRYQQGANALSNVLTYLPGDAPQRSSVMGQYAQALYFAADSTMTDQVREQVEKNLAEDPYEITTLGLLGINAFEQQKYQAAIDYWLTALQQAEGPAADSLRTGISKARDALIAEGKTVPELAVLTPAEIKVSVRLSNELKQKVSPEQTVFVFASPEGGKMPLAAVKLTVADLPALVKLDDSLAMMPEMRLSSVKSVDVRARVSLSGNPQSQPGDMLGSQLSVPVRGQNGQLELVIDQLVQ